MENTVAVNPKRAAKSPATLDENATPLELAFKDAYDFIQGKKGRAQRKDYDFARSINPAFASEIFKAVAEAVADDRGGKADSDKTLRFVETHVWPIRLPSGRREAYFKFHPGKKNKFKWAALSFVELPWNVSKAREKYGRMYLAVDYLDVYEGARSPASLVGQMSQWSLFVAHAFDRYAERVLKQRVTRTEALRLFSEASLTAESKALIESGKGDAIYVIKTKETCIYAFGYLSAARSADGLGSIDRVRPHAVRVPSVS